MMSKLCQNSLTTLSQSLVDLNIDVSVTPIGGTPDRRDWQTLKQTQRKAANLENIIKTLSSPVKKGVIKKCCW